MYTLASDKKLSVIASLLEGNSVRSTERMTGVHRDTICRLLVETGENCAALLDSNMRNVRTKVHPSRRNLDLRRQERQTRSH
jgi:transposase